MRSLILFDLHYEHDKPISRKKLSEIERIEGDFDSLILGGDNAELSPGLQNHRILFERLKKRFECPSGFIIGNHELWGKPYDISSWKLLNETFPALAEENDFVYLEQENLEVGENTFVGTYGHFDFSFFRKGQGVSTGDLLKGEFVIGKKRIIWQDMKLMDWEGQKDEEVCARLVKTFGERMEATRKPISVSHTIPRTSLNGWPDSLEQCFCESYSGSNLLGDVLETNGGEYHFCGHTHTKARAEIGKTTAINVGSHYRILRYAILRKREETYDLEEREVLLS